MYRLNRPDAMVPYCEDGIDQAGQVTDGHTNNEIRELLHVHPNTRSREPTKNLRRRVLFGLRHSDIIDVQGACATGFRGLAVAHADVHLLDRIHIHAGVTESLQRYLPLDP